MSHDFEIAKEHFFDISKRIFFHYVFQIRKSNFSAFWQFYKDRSMPGIEPEPTAYGTSALTNWAIAPCLFYFILYLNSNILRAQEDVIDRN